GGQADAGAVTAAHAAGAAGIQGGRAFALCRESGIDPVLRRRLIERALTGDLDVRNDPRASPTGFPFKMAGLPGTLASDDVYTARTRRCDLGYLRVPYRRPNGAVGYRCPAEPVDAYVRKGGTADETAGHRCLCNGLTATIGLAQHLDGGAAEPPLITLGQDLGFLPDLVARAGAVFTAGDVITHLTRPRQP
ncbi:MAG: nitronate monooxygenase, partial [Saccharothrix sp.]|nr:nitronate monooxygenase [Saccharothrix sp.]